MAAKFCQKCGGLLGGVSGRLTALRQAAPQPLQEKIRLASPGVEGERKPVTILFTDIVGSTALAARLDPEEWKEIVSSAHQRVSEAVYRYEGTIAQLLGDGVLAFFGAPITHEDDPVRAVHAALDIQRSISEYALQLRGYVDDFQMRIGIDTGLVVLGYVGSDMHMEYLPIGDAMNMAARLQSSARPGGVLISAATEKLVKAAFRLESMGEITVKGRSEPLEVFEALEFTASPGARRGIVELGSAFVGRRHELSCLSRAIGRVAEGDGEIVSVLGEAGIGKTRLIDECRRTSGLGLRWLEGRALSYGETLSFWTIRQLIKDDLSLSDTDPEPKVKAALRKRLDALFTERACDLLPYLAHLMDVSLDEGMAASIRQLDGETLKRQALWAISEYFSALAREQPLALVLEDLHWADPSSLEALEKLLALTDRVPLLLVLPARLEREHGSWQIKIKAETDYAHRYTELMLQPLSPGESNDLVDGLLQAADLPPQVRQLIIERSEGNPFYLEELVRSLVEQGLLLQEDECWHAAAGISEVHIPETLQAVLLARIDRLPEDVRRTLQLASVIGRSFLFSLLAAISEPGSPIDEHLALLQRLDLVREKTRRPELEYIFKHALTQEAAYNSLLLERRRDFHLRVGQALERLFAGRLAESYPLLAHHFDAAGAHDKAIEYLLKAGDKARLEDAHEEAIRDYQRATQLLEAEGDTHRLARTWLKLGLIHQLNFDFWSAHEANEKAFALERSAKPTRLAHSEGLAHFRQCGIAVQFSSIASTLDPSQVSFGDGTWLSALLFASLAAFDADTNLVPRAARSWEVLEGGTRYLFHLRDDMCWTDGSPLTAHDFEATWKHNLAPGSGSSAPEVFDEILGALDYRQGRSADPGSVGVHALDPLTLDVRLAAPVAHFIYRVAHPCAMALPLRAMQAHGADWWKPAHIVSSGPFRLVEWSPSQLVLARNLDYFGEIPGNVGQFTYILVSDRESGLRKYMDGEIDTVVGLLGFEFTPELEREAYPAFEHGLLFVGTTVLIPTEPPMDNPRLRRAIAQHIDRRAWANLYGGPQPENRYRGGIFPPGMAAYSPELGLPFDPAGARQLLVEAGYPGGKGMPPLKHAYPGSLPEMFAAYYEHLSDSILGFHQERMPMPTVQGWEKAPGAHMISAATIADYPDPHAFLPDSFIYQSLRARGWRNPRVEQLLGEAASLTDRARRMDLYRQVDRILVNEEVVVVPLDYGPSKPPRLVKPWVKGIKINTLAALNLADIVIEPH